jgi:uncharacterized protein (DUF3084 family)
VTTDERIHALTVIVDKMAGAINTLAGAVVARDSQIDAHDRQIEGLIQVAEKHDAQIAALAEQVANTERQWQAYLTRLSPI